MDEQKNNNDINLLAKEYAEQAVREARKSRGENGRNALTKLMILFSLAVLAFAVFIFATIAWFTMSREVGTGGMSMDSSNNLFELELSGTNVENSGTFVMADDTYEASLTTAGKSKITWAKTGTTDDDGHYPDGLTPNSHGKLEFWVVPNAVDSLDIVFEFNIRGFFGTYTPSAVEGEEPTLVELFEITDDLAVTVDNQLKNSTDVANKKAALEYIKGHLLFFSDYDGTYYSGFLGTGKSIRFGNCINPTSDPKTVYSADDAVSVTSGQKYKVTIYWKWANTLEQMVLDENSPYADNPLFVSTNTTDRTAIYNYLKDATNNQVFLNATDIVSNLNTIQSGTNINTALNYMTNKYDAADQLIGNNVDYILIDMTADLYSE